MRSENKQGVWVRGSRQPHHRPFSTCNPRAAVRRICAAQLPCRIMQINSYCYYDYAYLEDPARCGGPAGLMGGRRCQVHQPARLREADAVAEAGYWSRSELVDEATYTISRLMTVQDCMPGFMSRAIEQSLRLRHRRQRQKVDGATCADDLNMILIARGLGQLPVLHALSWSCTNIYSARMHGTRCDDVAPGRAST